MDCFNFHGVDTDHNNLYTFTKDRDKALSSLGPRIADAVLPGLSNSVPTTGSDLSKSAFSYQYLLASGNKVTASSFDSFMSTEERLKYANNIAVPSRIVEQSKLSPFSFLDQKCIDRLTRSSIDLKP